MNIKSADVRSICQCTNYEGQNYFTLGRTHGSFPFVYVLCAKFQERSEWTNIRFRLFFYVGKENQINRHG